MFKVCSTCKLNLELSNFNKNQHKCRLCQSIFNKEWSKKNREWRNLEKKQNYQDKKEQILLDKKIWYQENKEKVAEDRKDYRINHREEINARSKEWKIINKEWVREYNNTYNRTRKKSDPLYNLICALRSRTATVLKRNNWKKDTKFA